MDQFKNRLQSILSAVPPAQRVVVLVALAVLTVTVVIFARWLTQPSYTLLYSNLDDKALSQVIGELDSQGISYKIEGGGSRIMVPRQQVYQVRASLAEAGVAGEAVPKGYELLDGQGLAVSDFKQKVDYQRALEGEISKTLMAMDGVESASVRLAMPEEQLFSDEQKPVTASVLMGTPTALNQDQVDTVVFLVSSAVEGLAPGNVTVADSTGNVLSAPGDAGGSGGVGDRNMQLQREYEAALASDVQRLLTNVTPAAAASVVIHAQLNFDETQTESETYDPESQVVLAESGSTETLSGGGAGGAGGVVGVNGGQGTGGAAGGGGNYEKSDATAEYGVNREVTRTRVAPGQVENLSVAVVMDDGSLTGAEAPSEPEVEDLVAAAIGLDEERGDTIQVSALPFPKTSAKEEAAAAGGDIMSLLPTVAGVLVMILVAVFLFLMARGRAKSRDAELATLGLVPRKSLEPAMAAAIGEGSSGAIVQAAAGNGIENIPGGSSDARQEVIDLVQRQPEEIASLLRTWLADRRR